MTTYDIKVSELDEASHIADHPQNINITLKRHQLSLLHQCQEFERKRIAVVSQNGKISLATDPSQTTSYIRTHVGIIGDKVGSGKSYVILSLIAQDLEFEQDETLIRTFANNNIVVCTDGQPANVRTNVLVVPHNLLNQWGQYFSEFSDTLRGLVVMKTRQLEHLSTVDINTYDVIMVSCTYYNRLAMFLADRKYKVRRVFYDEADNMNIPSCAKIDAMFYWFVTASYGNLLYPRGYSAYDIVTKRYIVHAYGLKNSGFVKDMFVDLHSEDSASQVSRMLVAKNTDEYVAKSIDLPPQLNMYVKCRTPLAIDILSGIADKNIIDALNANDIDSALEYITPQHRKSEDSIVTIMIDKYQRQIKNFELRLEYSQYMEYDTEDERTQEIQRLNTKREEIKHKIKSIENRIRQNSTCSICLENADRRTIVPCCTNGFCFKCLNLWLTRKKECPLCKKPVTIQDIYVIENSDMEVENDTARQDMSENIHESNDKIKNLENIFKKQAGQNNKYLLFSSFDNSFDKVVFLLEKLGMRYAFLKGNSYNIKNYLDRYKNGDIQVLLVNAKNYGSGLNLENTTDVIMFHKFDTEIEKQVIGRAQRYGRATPLRVWYLLYSNEFTEDMRGMEYSGA